MKNKQQQYNYNHSAAGRESQARYRASPKSAARKRRHRLRIKNTIGAILGNKCVHCGCGDQAILELDHINAEKTILNYWRKNAKQEAYSKHIRGVDITKEFQLLCVPCHKKKTKQQKDWMPKDRQQSIEIGTAQLGLPL